MSEDGKRTLTNIKIKLKKSDILLKDNGMSLNQKMQRIPIQRKKKLSSHISSSVFNVANINNINSSFKIFSSASEVDNYNQNSQPL